MLRKMPVFVSVADTDPERNKPATMKFVLSIFPAGSESGAFLVNTFHMFIFGIVDTNLNFLYS